LGAWDGIKGLSSGEGRLAFEFLKFAKRILASPLPLLAPPAQGKKLPPVSGGYCSDITSVNKTYKKEKKRKKEKEGADAIAGGREKLFRKKLLSPPCTPLTLPKLFQKRWFCDRYSDR